MDKENFSPENHYSEGENDYSDTSSNISTHSFSSSDNDPMNMNIHEAIERLFKHDKDIMNLFSMHRNFLEKVSDLLHIHEHRINYLFAENNYLKEEIKKIKKRIKDQSIFI